MATPSISPASWPTTTAGESVTKQTQEVLSIIDGHLTKAGSDKSKLLTTTIYLTDMKTFAEMNAVWDGWVSPGNTPARATVEVKLAAPQYTVEIMVTAARVARRRSRRDGIPPIRSSRPSQAATRR